MLYMYMCVYEFRAELGALGVFYRFFIAVGFRVRGLGYFTSIYFPLRLLNRTDHY